MSSSKILRDANLQCRSVVMNSLEDVNEFQAGSFVVCEMAPESVSSAVGDEPSAGGVVAAPEVAPEPQVDIEALCQQARAEGRQAGLDEAEVQLGTLTQSLAAACTEISSLRKKMLERSREDMLRLVLAIAERVVLAELSSHKEVINRTVQQAIQAAVSAEEFHIKINPADLEQVQEHKPLFIASLSGLSNIEFVPDPTVTAGGCMLESPMGRVDATIESQLDEIASSLREALEEG